MEIPWPPPSIPHLPAAVALREGPLPIAPREPSPVRQAGVRPTKERPGTVRDPEIPDIRPPPRENDRSPSPRGNAGARSP